MKHNERNKAYDLEVAKKELLAEETPVKVYNWEDDAYELDDPKHPNYHDNWSDYADNYGDEQC